MKSVSSLDSITKEFESQPALLDSFLESEAWRGLEGERNPVMVGAGDSYAASLCASFMVGPQVHALDPFSLMESIEWAREKTVCIISISGRTTSNIDVARALKGVAKKTIAITCDSTSRLAAVVDDVVELPFRPMSKSPGIASFTLSLAAALKVCGIEASCDFRAFLSLATARSKQIQISNRGVTHFVGNNEAYAASTYGAAKVYEFLGGKAQTSLLEEFSHMQLFSLSTSDRINVIEPAAGNKGTRLSKELRENGYRAPLFKLEGTRIEGLYLLVFAMQAAAIREARKRGLRLPYFLTAKRKLRISDEMIY